MFYLEELTQGELIGWIRENVSELDERKIVLNVLRQRQDQLREVRDKVLSQIEETSNQIAELVQKHVGSRPVKTGVRLSSWPVEAAQEYKRLDQLLQEAKLRFDACLREDNAIGWKIIEIQDEQIKQLTQKS